MVPIGVTSTSGLLVSLLGHSSMGCCVPLVSMVVGIVLLSQSVIVVGMVLLPQSVYFVGSVQFLILPEVDSRR